MVKIEPLKDAERRYCAQCGQSMISKDRTLVCLAGWVPVRRVIAVKNDTRYLSTVTYYPRKDSLWGYDGLFCRLRCAQTFAHRAHGAGFRIKRK